MKKKILIIMMMVLVLLLGATYAWFTYYGTTSNQRAIAGDIYLKLNSGTDVIYLENVFPERVVDARERLNNTITFTVAGKNESSNNVYYEIVLNHGDDRDNLERFEDKDLMFDLIEVNNNQETYLLDAVSFDTINNKRIWVETVNANQETEITKTYKIRMWIREDVLISDTDPNRSYYATGEHAYKNHYASVKVGVRGDFTEKSINNAYQIVKMDYNDEKANLFTLAHQDSVGDIGHQNVYYYTEDTNSNVLFNDTCWQIVRTTDTGGVKLLYNGLAEQKQVYETNTPLTDSDITVATNTNSYPYTYSSNWWTSGEVPNSGTGTITFTVNEAGYYTIDYDVSTEVGNDVMYIYKDNVLLRQDSGTIEDGLRLGNLTTSNVIKIEYKKNGSTTAGRDNIKFKITKGSGNNETVTSCDTKRLPTTGLIGTYTTSNLGNGTYKYGTTYTYTSSGFTLGGTISDAQWSDTTYENLLGKYTCANTSTTCTTLYYVQTYNSSVQAGVSKYTIGITGKYNEIGKGPFNEHFTSVSSVGYMYNNTYKYKTKVGTDVSGVNNIGTITYGASYTENGNQYEITSSTTLQSSEWAANYASVKNKYLCPGSSSTCNKEDLRYITNTTNSKYTYFKVDTAYRFGHDVTYSNGVYTLTGTTQDVANWPVSYSANNNILQNTHYTCFNEEGSNECGDKVYFVYWTDASNIRYIELTNGKTKDDALYEMLNYKGNDATKIDANINKYDSAIKQMIDHWYVNVGLTSKTQKIEDTIYCNDRSIRNNDLRNWDLSKTTKESRPLLFKMYNTSVSTNTLTCSNVTDQFSTKNSKAKLTYPVGLLTEQERALMMNKSGGVYARTGLMWWLASPYVMDSYGTLVINSGVLGGFGYRYLINEFRVRPSLTLASDVEFTNGSGTYDDAYVVE